MTLMYFLENAFLNPKSQMDTPEYQARLSQAYQQYLVSMNKKGYRVSVSHKGKTTNIETKGDRLLGYNPNETYQGVRLSTFQKFKDYVVQLKQNPNSNIKGGIGIADLEDKDRKQKQVNQKENTWKAPSTKKQEPVQQDANQIANIKRNDDGTLTLLDKKGKVLFTGDAKVAFEKFGLQAKTNYTEELKKTLNKALSIIR